MLQDIDKFRLIISPESSARENMAIDEAILKNYKDGDYPIIRFYKWGENSVTIGISQKNEEYNYLENTENKIAKRVTGGGVLFHGHDVSYSLIIPSYYLNNLSVKESYENICLFLLEFYSKLGLDVCYAKDDKNIVLSKSDFCQVGFEAYDIIVNGQKIGGNAQRRTKKVIFQHGSIPIEVTKSNINSEKIGACLEDFNIKLTYDEVIKVLITSFKKSFNVETIESELNKEELNLKEKILKEKYD